jgi:double-stranded uracil-DNA glycosylase
VGDRGIRIRDELEPEGMILPGPYPFQTLPDCLKPGLDLVFVGINPGLYSVKAGHYFARPTSRFWPAFSRSALSAGIRASLRKQRLGPEDDRALMRFGIGFTDVVKVPSRSAADLRPPDYRVWAPRLRARLEAAGPLVACFHGLTGYRAFARYALDEPTSDWRLGVQPLRLGRVRLFVIPNPSPANAHFQMPDYIAWYDRVARFLKRAAREAGRCCCGERITAASVPAARPP